MKKLLIIIVGLTILSPILFSQKPYFRENNESYSVYKGGRKISKLKFEEHKYFSEGFAAVKLNNQWGYLNSKGKFAIKPKYQSAQSFNNGLAIVELDNKSQIINQFEEPLTEPFDTIYRMKDYFIVGENELLGIIDSEGAFIQTPKFEQIVGLYKGKFTVKEEGKWGNLENGELNFDNPDLYFLFPDSKPRYSKECALEMEKEELLKCDSKQMLTDLYMNIKYPAIARETGIQGTVLTQFVIDESGNMIDPEIIHDIGGECGAATLDALAHLKNKWFLPGIHEGEKVKTVIYLPTKFRLE